jgi:hypothetical protein
MTDELAFKVVRKLARLRSRGRASSCDASICVTVGAPAAISSVALRSTHENWLAKTSLCQAKARPKNESVKFCNCRAL